MVHQVVNMVRLFVVMGRKLIEPILMLAWQSYISEPNF